jgi:2-dehydropantoate 2-reductase
LKKEKIKIGFIGAGAIGSLFGGYLAAAIENDDSIEIIFFARADHVNAINAGGLTLQRGGSFLTLKNIKAFENYSNYKDSLSSDKEDQFEYIFITTKAYDTINVIRAYKNLIKTSKWVILLQNGIGNEYLVKPYVKNEKLVRIITSHGAILKKPGFVVHTGSGFTKMGLPFPEVYRNNRIIRESNKLSLNRLKMMLESSQIETEIVDDIIRYTWEKAFVNIGINAIGALTRLTNGALLKLNPLRVLMEAVVKEALNVAEAQELNFEEVKYVNLMFSVAEQTASNENSMLQDINAKKPTEIDFLNGKVVELAAICGIDVPLNSVLTNLIKGLVQSYLSKA